jgi:hypothetical protein
MDSNWLQWLFKVLSDKINQECRNSSVVTQNCYINIGRMVKAVKVAVGTYLS